MNSGSAVHELRDVPQATRDDAKASDFAGKNRSFPILKPEDVAAAAKAMGRAGADNYSAAKLKSNIIRIAKRKGAAFVAKLPKAWRSGEHAAAKPFENVFSGLIQLAEGEGDQPSTSWIQLFKTGKFWDPRYGTFSITTKDLSEILDNFKSVTPEAPYRLPVDYNHGTSHPKSAEEGKAAGWITDLSLRAGGDELWGLVEWTKQAADMITAKEYQFVSPTFAYQYTHTSGEEIGTTLLAAAITNRPVLEGMAPLTLSQPRALRLADAGAAEGPDEDVEAMFSFDEQRRRVQAALTDAFGVAYGFGDCGPCAGCYLVDLFDGRAVYREYVAGGSGDLYEVPFEITADGDVHFTGTPIEVVADYRQLAGEQAMAKTITVKDAKGNEVQLAEETVVTLAKEHAPKPAAGETVDLAKFTELSKKVEDQEAKILDLSSKNLALQNEAKERDAKTRVETLVTAGKVPPADREELVKMAIETPDAFTAFEKQMAKRAAVIEYGKRVGSGEEGGGEKAVDQVMALARADMEKDPKLSKEAAIRGVLARDGELYERYKQESAVRV